MRAMNPFNTAQLRTIAADHGTPLWVYDAATIRERADIRADRRAQSAQARLSAQIMSALPIGFTGWAVATDSRTARFVFGTPFGLVCLGAGVGLDVLGWRWMRRIVGSP